MAIVRDSVYIVWVLFWIFWFLAAASAKKGRRSWSHDIRARIVVIVLAIAASQGGFLHVQQHPLRIFQVVIGQAMLFLGLALSIWARIHMGRDWGMPMSVKSEPVLVTSGPYRRVRHPIYSGILLASLGTAIAVSWVWLYAVVWGGVYFLYSAVIEERNLLIQFPTTYPEYRRTTKMLIPFIL